MRPTYLAPLGRASPHAAAAPLRRRYAAPLCAASPLRAALPRRYTDPRSASRRSGIAAPASATAPPLTRLGAACAGAAVLASPAHLRRAWRAAGGTRSRCARSPRGPVPCGQSGPREDRQGSSRRSAALFRPAGFGWGRARRCGTRQPAASPTPPPIRARATPSAYARRSNPPNGGFPTPLVRPRLSRPFSGSFRRFGGYKCPRAFISPEKWPQRRCRPPATRPECPATRETRGHLLHGGLPARRGLWTAPGTVPTARGASGLGSRPLGAPRHDLSIL